jgi:transcriptional regulator of arginine metabolism
MTKKERLFTIKEIIAAKSIENQDKLRLELKRRGCDVTQATLSRDLKMLGVIWIPTPDGGHYTLQQSAAPSTLSPIVGAEVVGIAANESMVVVRTLPGCANTVGEFIDGLRAPDILGTLAGDNTVLVIPQSVRKSKTIVQFLKLKLIGTL